MAKKLVKSQTAFNSVLLMFNDFELFINKKTCIKRHPPDTNFCTYRILDQQTNSAAG